MLEAYGNLWDIASEGHWDAIVITTNGYVRKDGEAVMGRGVALEARNTYPGIASELGTKIKNFGNHVHLLWGYDERFPIASFPVKPTFGPHGEPGWKAKAEYPIVMRSVGELRNYVDRYHWMDILMPRPGCGFGGLKWEDVKPKIDGLLDNRFTVVTFHP